MPSCEIEQAVRFLYLNRVCFNGLYRVNLRGEFNVPIGSKVEVMFPNGFLRAISDRLRHARLMESDFEAVIAQAGRNDFVFIDPPYTVTHNNNGFIKYNDVLFSWEDQIRLAKAAMSAKRRGSLVFVSNADHAAVRELYDGFHFHHQLSRASILSAASSARKRTSESAFLSYRPSSSLSP